MLRLSAALLLALLQLTHTLPSTGVSKLNPLTASRYLADSTVPGFNLHFDCDGATDFCQKAEAAVQSAATRISSFVDLQVPVNVNMSLFRPCNLTPTSSVRALAACDQMSTLGFASPNAFITARLDDDGQIYYLPQALAKQSKLPLDPKQLSQYDILSAFNALNPWWFSSDNTPITPDKRDFEYTVTHELLHGLGFGIDGLINLASSIVGHSVVTPIWDNSGTDGVNFQFIYPFIWTRYLFTADGQPIVPMLSVFNNAVRGKVNPSMSETDFVTLALSDPNALNTAENLFDMATTNNSLYFRTNTNNKMFLETGLTPFQAGGSLGHVSTSYNWTGDFLMVWALGSETLDVKASQYSVASTHGIGFELLDMLQTLGYNIKSPTPDLAAKLSSKGAQQLSGVLVSEDQNLMGSAAGASPSRSSGAPAASPTFGGSGAGPTASSGVRRVLLAQGAPILLALVVAASSCLL
ncbi:hypothetical protein RI367_001478 [Sorochytrium milnesiophthora]